MLAPPVWMLIVTFAWAVAAAVVLWRLRCCDMRPHRPPEGSPLSMFWALLTGMAAAQFAVELLRTDAPTLVQQAMQPPVVFAAGIIAMLATLAALDRSAACRQIGLPIRVLPRGAAVGTALVLVIWPIAMVVGLAVLLIAATLGLEMPSPHPSLLLLQRGDEPLVSLLVLLGAVVMAPLAEEIAYRGLLQRMFHGVLARYGQMPASAATALAIVLSSLLFVTSHAQPLHYPPLLALSLALGVVYHRTQNLYAAILLHACFNAMQIALFVALPAAAP